MLNCNAASFPIVSRPTVAPIRSGLRRPSLEASLPPSPSFQTLSRNCYAAFLPAPSVTFAVTTGAKCNQVLHHVTAELASAFYVMELQVLYGTAFLAPPAISF